MSGVITIMDRKTTIRSGSSSFRNRYERGREIPMRYRTSKSRNGTDPRASRSRSPPSRTTKPPRRRK